MQLDEIGYAVPDVPIKQGFGERRLDFFEQIYTHYFSLSEGLSAFA
jgi:hypothetical protein